MNSVSISRSNTHYTVLIISSRSYYDYYYWLPVGSILYYCCNNYESTHFRPSVPSVSLSHCLI